MDSATKLDRPAIDHTKEVLSFMASSAHKIVKNLSSGKKSLTFMEGLLVALAKNHGRLSKIEEASFKILLEEKALDYVSLPSFTNVQRYALSSESIVKTRLGEAITLFGNEGA